MYVPPEFRETRLDVLHALIRQHSFGTLVSQQAGKLVATHLPFLLDAQRGPNGTLLGHLARANDHWRGWADGGEALVIFQGPHGYVSPAWYHTHPSVPTWNYVAVHAYGTPRLMENPSTLRRLLETMVQTYEPTYGASWKLELPADYYEQMLGAIVGFELEITRLQGKLKLSQNRPAADRQGVLAALTHKGDPSNLELANAMATLPKSHE